MPPIVSIVIRTYNEAKRLHFVLQAIAEQRFGLGEVEVLIVDSGSTDNTLAIANEHKCRIVEIRKDEFSFGRSLNLGCQEALGKYLVFVSGHCIPVNMDWLRLLIEPLDRGEADYVYGRQIGNEVTRFSEKQIFEKYFPASEASAQGGFFCNNANAALRTDVWRNDKFDEILTGLEDMDLAKRLLSKDFKIAYASGSVVYHIHDETWHQIRNRYEREAIALQKVMPELHLHISDFLRYFSRAVMNDFSIAIREGAFMQNCLGIVQFRFMQYLGSYRGNSMHRTLTRQAKERYFYPK